jgi:hypothetical protein
MSRTQWKCLTSRKSAGIILTSSCLNNHNFVWSSFSSSHLKHQIKLLYVECTLSIPCYFSMNVRMNNEFLEFWKLLQQFRIDIEFPSQIVWIPRNGNGGWQFGSLNFNIFQFLEHLLSYKGTQFSIWKIFNEFNNHFKCKQNTNMFGHYFSKNICKWLCSIDSPCDW